MQGDPGGKVSNLGGHSISQSKEKVCMYVYPILNGFQDSYFTVQLQNC
jgi:hypothetical protein